VQPACASREYVPEIAVPDGKLKMIKVKDLMTTNVVTVLPDTTLRELYTILQKERVTGVPVLDSSGKLVGVVSQRDLIVAETQSLANASAYSDIEELFSSRFIEDDRIMRRRFNWVEEIMTRRVITTQPDATIRDVCRLMCEKQVKRLPVVAGDKFVGIISFTDVMKFFANMHDSFWREIDESTSPDSK
jgi:CBS domain-containing protein